MQHVSEAVYIHIYLYIYDGEIEIEIEIERSIARVIQMGRKYEQFFVFCCW